MVDGLIARTQSRNKIQRARKTGEMNPGQNAGGLHCALDHHPKGISHEDRDTHRIHGLGWLPVDWSIRGQHKRRNDDSAHDIYDHG
jgi:hypothetical protein